jgi:hypothetical protein
MAESPADSIVLVFDHSSVSSCHPRFPMAILVIEVEKITKALFVWTCSPFHSSTPGNLL